MGLWQGLQRSGMNSDEAPSVGGEVAGMMDLG